MTRTRAAAIGLVLLALGVGLALGRYRATRIPDLAEHQARIEGAARAAGLEPALLLALVAAESGGDPDAVSAVGAVGLCQLMPATAEEEARRLRVEEYSPARLTEPELNVTLGASYLSRLLGQFEGDEVWALAAYNAGATNARRWQQRAPDVSSEEAVRREGFAETRGFVSRVLRFRDAYARQPSAR